MAVDTAPIPIEALRGRRGVSTRVLLDMNDALAPCIEGQALADEVKAGVARITTAAMAGSRYAVVNEAGRLAYRAEGYRDRFRQMAGEIEGPDDDAA